MNTHQLACKIAGIEGKKSQARIGDIKEILKIFFDILYAMPEAAELLNAQMEKRRNKKKN